MSRLTEEDLRKLESLSDYEILERISFYVKYIRDLEGKLNELKFELEKPDDNEKNYFFDSDIEKEAFRKQIERIEEKHIQANEKVKEIVISLANRLKEGKSK